MYNPPCHNKTKNMKDIMSIENETSFTTSAAALGDTFQGQLEMAFAGSPSCSTPRGRRERLNRANWWFQRMRQIVDLACEWQPVPEPRPEQTWLPGTYRQPSVAPHINRDERQICE